MAASTNMIQALEQEFIEIHELFENENAIAYALEKDEGNHVAFPIFSRTFRRVIRRLASKKKINLTKEEAKSLAENIGAAAFSLEDIRTVFFRTAPFQDGVEIDHSDANNTRTRVTSNGVIAVTNSDTPMGRNGSMRALPILAENGDPWLLQKYVNLSEADFWLLVAWIAYTLGHAKISSTKFVILILSGNQGSGKSFLCRLISMLIDPGLGVQAFPGSKKDLAIAAQHSHLLMFDNMRSIRPDMADILCMTIAKSVLASRQLYTDSEQSVLNLHAALILNGIHAFVDQPDLAERSLTLRLPPIDPEKRESESVLETSLERDLPVIYRGILDLISGILRKLPDAKVSHPERMIDFCYWLAALEDHLAIEHGALQQLYSQNLNQTMCDSMQESSLAVAIMRLVAEDGEWAGTPKNLMAHLNSRYGAELSRAPDWPRNEISLSKRLSALLAGLQTQGIDVTFSRGKERQIAIAKYN